MEICAFRSKRADLPPGAPKSADLTCTKSVCEICGFWESGGKICTFRPKRADLHLRKNVVWDLHVLTLADLMEAQPHNQHSNQSTRQPEHSQNMFLSGGYQFLNLDNEPSSMHLAFGLDKDHLPFAPTCGIDPHWHELVVTTCPPCCSGL